MERKIYQMTEKQTEKYQPFAQSKYDADLEAFDSHKSEYGKKFGLKKRDYALTLMACTREYAQGCWQGKLDRASGLEYSEERSENVYNLGYYRGYNESLSGYIADAKKSNPNFSFLNEAK